MATVRRTTAVERVRGEILTGIRDGDLVEGDKLPNEYELAGRFTVSRPTVREAIQSLVDSGHLTRRRGTGTFVAQVPSRYALDTNISYTAMIREAGREPGETVLQTGRRACAENERQQLELPAGEEIVEVERIHSGDERPLIYSRDRIPARMLGDAAGEMLGHSLYARLAVAGHRVTRATARLTPTIADARLASLLEVHAGAPILHIHQVDHDRDGLPVMLSDEWHVADAFGLIVNRRAPEGL
jgi:GntR family transcriptional regulator